MSPLVNKYEDRLKDYVDVKERIKLFYAAHPDGRLVTGDVTVSEHPDGTTRVVVQALAYRTPDDPLPGIGWSWLAIPGTTNFTRGSEIENAETSAWGRAIGSLGIGIEKSIASADEVRTKSDDGSEPTGGVPAGPPPPPPGPLRDGLIGTAEVGKGDADFQLRQTPDGFAIAFRLVQGRTGYKVLAFDAMAQTIASLRGMMEGQRVTVYGTLVEESFKPKGSDRHITYYVVHATRITTPDGTFPAPDERPETPAEPNDPPSIPLPFDMAAVDEQSGGGS
jgi:hypothetical protein